MGAKEWHHVVVSVEYPDGCAGFFPEVDEEEVGHRDTLFVDGFAYPVSFPPGVVGLLGAPGDNLVGASLDTKENPTDWMTGSVDDVAIYDEPLREEEVEAHLAIGNVEPPSVILLEPGEAVDSDEDGILDSADNCPSVANPEQQDSDLDGIGNACEGEPDADGDEIPDETDNCPEVSNAEQTDTNEDGIGDACEE